MFLEEHLDSLVLGVFRGETCPITISRFGVIVTQAIDDRPGNSGNIVVII